MSRYTPSRCDAEPIEYGLYLSSKFKYVFAAGFVEAVGQMNDLNGKIPEPFDIANHAGNLMFGGVVGVVAAAGAHSHMRKQLGEDAPEHSAVVPEESIKKYRKFAVAASAMVALAINAVTETKWGVDNLPVARMLYGTTADPLDAIYSTAFAAGITTSAWSRLRPATRQSKSTS
ncbi:MAG: hypothetical protein QG659_734 [Patescibacteria group bacterium]|jgi:hypothetical protein|nr:hypothetical protein [Patescibacteria group bacterium]